MCGLVDSGVLVRFWWDPGGLRWVLVGLWGWILVGPGGALVSSGGFWWGSGGVLLAFGGLWWILFGSGGVLVFRGGVLVLVGF